jgi:alginate O-acetyltransferase complex protein AlgI
MLFNSIDFILFFLPVVLLLFYSVPVRARLYVLCLSSLFFYGWSGIIPLLFMIAAILWGFLTAIIFQSNRKKWSVVVSIIFPLMILYVYKYLNFTFDTFVVGLETRDSFYFLLAVVLPPGISFYTFQIVSYSIDIYDDTYPVERNLLKLATYISFFAQLIAGPILRYDQISAQLTRISTEKILKPNIIGGLKLISIGLFTKVYFADVLAFFQGPHFLWGIKNPLDAAFHVFAYSFQIYYDFWSYSVIAIGLGRLFSIELPINFKEPYVSLNPKIFWRNWHVTLSYWMRDYLYLRLGGNNKYLRNIIIVFLLVGLWHGAGWNFVAWGGYHAILVVLYHLTRSYWDRMPGVIQIAITFLLVSLAWPLFKFGFVETAVLLGKMFDLSQLSAPAIYSYRPWTYLGIIAGWTFLAREKHWLYNTKSMPLFDWPLAHAALFCAAVFSFPLSKTFIYFRF